MKKVNIVLRVLAVPGLLATVLASCQDVNSSASTTKSAAVLQTRQSSDDPSRFSYPLLYCTPDGNSHFQDVSVELPRIDFAPPAAPIHIGGNVAASSTFFGGFEAGWGEDDLKSRLYHPAPAAQFIVVLQGDFSLIATDGEMRQFLPGDVFRVEDTPPCKGHITVVGETPGFFLFAR
jgi:hypothetical protein